MLPLQQCKAQQGKQGGDRNTSSSTGSRWLQQLQNSLKFNSWALWPTEPTVLDLLDGNCYSSHQSQHVALQVGKSKAQRPPPFRQGPSLNIQGKMGGSLDRFTVGWQRITRSFPASSSFLLGEKKKEKSLSYVGFPSPLPSKV